MKSLPKPSLKRSLKPLQKHLKNIFTVVLVLLATPIAPKIHAQDKSAEEIPWYQVEVIIFSHLDQNDKERRRTDIELSYPSQWVKLMAEGEVPPTNSNSVINPAIATQVPTGTTIKPEEEPYVLLPDDQRQLVADSQVLRRIHGYQVLYHSAWRQPGYDRHNSPWILIQGGRQFNDHYELEGSIRLVRNRYLHIQANLWKSQFVRKLSASPIGANQDYVSETAEAGNPTLATWPKLPLIPQPEQPVDPADLATADETNPIRGKQLSTVGTDNYQAVEIVVLNQSTRVSRDELTYLDHPEMGALILVSRYDRDGENKTTQ